MEFKRTRNSVAVALAAFALAALLPSAAFASVKKEGAWPDADKAITIDASGLSRSEAVRRVADAAGWNVVVHAPPGDPIDIHVKGQPAGKVLALVLNDAAYVARRDGTLIDIQREDAGASALPTAAAVSAVPATATPSATVASAPTSTVDAPPAVPITPPPPTTSSTPTTPSTPTVPSMASRSKSGEDRVVTGGSLRIEKDEVVDDVTVMGGSLEVLGHVEGDVVVMGGTAKIRNGAHVEGDATAVGGALDIESGATVDGDVGVVGGVLTREPGAIIGGKTITHGKPEKGFKVKIDKDPSSASAASANGSEAGWLASKTRDLGGALTRCAMLFLFGAVLLALATRRLNVLKAEAAARPMRSIAIGVVGTIAALFVAALLCITVIGIPVVIVGVLMATFGSYAGVCAVLTTAGERVARHKTNNVYMHLLVGCALFLVLGSLPWIGGAVTAAVAFAGIGVMFATRGAGLIAPRPNGPASGPYRSGGSTLV